MGRLFLFVRMFYCFYVTCCENKHKYNNRKIFHIEPSFQRARIVTVYRYGNSLGNIVPPKVILPQKKAFVNCFLTCVI